MEITENELQDIKSYDVQHLPIIRAYMEKMGVVEIIDRDLNCKMAVSPGRVVIGLVLDILSGRTPVYRVQDFFEHQDIELLVGEGIPLSAFGDDNIGRILDRIFDYGTQKLFSEISIQVVKAFGLKTDICHSDTTSVNVWGGYFESENQPGPTITYGHSKDLRPDLKQYVFSLLSVEKNIPIMGKTLDGNASDKAINNQILNDIARYMAQYGQNNDFIYVADSALVTPDNLALMGGLNDEQKISFISRLPETYNECGRIKSEAMIKNQWFSIGYLAQGKPTEKRPHAYYKSYDSMVTIDGKTYRAVVIHSDMLDKRRQKKIDRRIQTDYETCEKICNNLNKQIFMCEPDAIIATQRHNHFAYHHIDWKVKQKPIYQRGRPRNGERKIVKMTYVLETTISKKQSDIQKLQEEAGCFVLITNLLPGHHTGQMILEIYKEQHGIEQNFGFLKDPLIVNDLFLKTPKRIEALGFILLIALLVWRLLERTMRKTIAKSKIKIIGWNKRLTDLPTAFMMMTKFCGVHVLKLHHKRWFSRPLNEAQLQFLSILGLSPNIFISS